MSDRQRELPLCTKVDNHLPFAMASIRLSQVRHAVTGGWPSNRSDLGCKYWQ